MTFTVVGRSLIVTPDEGSTFRVLPSSETGNPAIKRESMTWRWEDDNGRQYRIQYQVTG